MDVGVIGASWMLSIPLLLSREPGVADDAMDEADDDDVWCVVIKIDGVSFSLLIEWWGLAPGAVALLK
jgi:hypothetical protein